MSLDQRVLYQYVFLPLFLLASSSSSPSPCPPHLRAVCECSTARQARYRCAAAGSRFILEATFNERAVITCLGNTTLTPADLPPFPVSNNRTLQELGVTSCALAGTISDVLRALGAAGARRVVVRQARGAVGDELVGLDGVEILQLDDNELQTSLPWQALAGLTSLEDLRVMAADLDLTPGAWPVNTQLRSLQLITAGVARVPPGALSSLPSLEELTISNSGLDILEEGSFRGLVNLRSLYLNSNPLRALRRGVLRDAPGLRALHAQAARLRELQGGALEGLDQLEEVSFEHGTSALTLGPGALSRLPALRKVSLQGTSLTPLPADLLRGSSALLRLTLARCDLVELPRELLIDQVSLQTLNLSENRLRSLNPDQFWSLAGLQELDLSDNLLETLPDNIFAGLNSLLALRLDGNRLSVITKATFSGASRLQLLTINDNQLSFEKAMQSSGSGLVGSPFAYLLSLRTLDLRNNSIAAIFDDWRLSWLDIQLIDLSWNKITELKEIDTLFVTNVTVDLRHNLITSVTPWTDPRHRTDQATFLLSHNPLRCDCSLYPFLNYTQHTQEHRFKIEEATCKSPAELQNKSLQTLPITSLTCSVNDICPRNCQCVKRPVDSTLELDCQHAPSLTDYPDAETRMKQNIIKSRLKLRNLTEVIKLPDHVYSLDLSDLNLQNVPFVPDTLTEMDLTNNLIKNIPIWLSQRSIHLRLPNNTLRCGCGTQNELKQLSEYNVQDFGKLFCNDGRQLVKIDVDALCNVIYASLIGGTFAVIGLVSAVASVVIYKNAKVIKKFIYDKGWNVFIVEEEIDGKTFDVLVSYPDEMEQYVFERLVPQLEQMEYSVSVRYRDWYIGDWIPDKVATLVQKSRRTLVLLSNLYPDSIARLELQMAQRCQLRDKRERVVFAAPKDLIPSDELQTLLDKRKYLNLDDESFLSSLRRRLPKRKKKGYERMSQKTRNMVQSSGDVIYSSKKSLNR